MEIIRLALALIIFLMLLISAGARDGEGMRVVPAQEILDKIEKGKPVEYDHVIVEGDLDLGKVKLPKRHVNRTKFEIEFLGLSESAMLVSSPIRVNDSTVRGNISFANTIFINHVNFRSSKFNSSADFKYSIFIGDADFDYSIFNGNADFLRTTFNDFASFYRSTFNGFAGFRGSVFKRYVFFMGSTFNGNADFENSAFNSTADFANSAFNGDVDFKYSAFDSYARFSNSDFNGDVNFDNSDFNSDAGFMGSDFKGFAGFESSNFNGYADFWRSAFTSYAEFDISAFNGTADFRYSDFNSSFFSSAEFNKPVYFNDANFSNGISFNGSHFKEDVLFEGAIFNGPLFLTRAKYDRLYIRWNSIKELGYDDAAYLALLENFKKLGYVEDYDACYYQYRRLHRDQTWSGKYHAMNPWEEWLRKRIDLGLQAFYGYGKKPIWPLLWSIGTILLFGLIWRKAGVDGGRGSGGIFERFAPKSRKQSLGEKAKALIGAMLFSAVLFLSGTRLFVDPPALPALEGWFAAHARGFFIAERVLGAFFSILFFLAVSGTVVR